MYMCKQSVQTIIKNTDLNGYELRKSLGKVSLGSREKNNKETCQTERKEGDQFPMQ